jgi:hypothetical protein
VNVQVIADPSGRLVWASTALPGARHDMGAAREHGIIDAIADVGVRAVGSGGLKSEMAPAGRFEVALPRRTVPGVSTHCDQLRREVCHLIAT